MLEGTPKEAGGYFCWVVELGNGSPYTGGSTGAERPDLDERRAERALTVTPICVQKPIF